MQELALAVMRRIAVWGSRDRLLPPGTLELFWRAMPAAEVVLIERSGHLPHLESPRTLARALVRPLGR